MTKQKRGHYEYGGRRSGELQNGEKKEPRKPPVPPQLVVVMLNLVAWALRQAKDERPTQEAVANAVGWSDREVRCFYKLNFADKNLTVSPRRFQAACDAAAKGINDLEVRKLLKELGNIACAISDRTRPDFWPNLRQEFKEHDIDDVYAFIQACLEHVKDVNLVADLKRVLFHYHAIRVRNEEFLAPCKMAESPPKKWPLLSDQDFGIFNYPLVSPEARRIFGNNATVKVFVPNVPTLAHFWHNM